MATAFLLLQSSAGLLLASQLAGRQQIVMPSARISSLQLVAAVEQTPPPPAAFMPPDDAVAAEAEARRAAAAAAASARFKANAAAAAAAAPPIPTQAPINLPDLPKSKIRRGDFVVHQHYGIGLFEGVFRSQTFQLLPNGTKVPLKALKIKFKDGFLEIFPRDASKDLKLFKRKEDVEAAYETVKLDGMRSRKSWQKRKERAAKKVWDVAADLVAMYAERQQLTREPCSPDAADPRIAAFAAAFPYEPTPDQQRTFDEVAHDMVEMQQPMDRLVCGDVGFGKTEVAMRAIYRAVCSGRQVALLAPTTVLAAQHYRCLLARMPDVRVELLSSLMKRKASETQAIRDGVADGHVQVLVGTHAILSPKISFHNLGLLVVDEEQRFGVRQKEKVKTAAKQSDVLSLSATPIPRTMYMCMAGIRAMSTLATPPKGRLAVKTIVSERDDVSVRPHPPHPPHPRKPPPYSPPPSSSLTASAHKALATPSLLPSLRHALPSLTTPPHPALNCPPALRPRAFAECGAAGGQGGARAGRPGLLCGAARRDGRERGETAPERHPGRARRLCLLRGGQPREAHCGFHSGRY